MRYRLLMMNKPKSILRLKPTLSLALVLSLSLPLFSRTGLPENAQKLPDNKVVVEMKKQSDSLYILQSIRNGEVLSEWKLPYQVYHFECGDLNGDGIDEVTVGVIKPTRHWKTSDKRLFIFKLYKGEAIRPLWLGSRVGSPLEDFALERDSVPMMIRTKERLKDSTIVERIYKLKKGFGIECIKY